MQSLWPWLAVAGIGALHGLSPANGWMFAAACGVRAGDGAQARLALLPIAAGHAASVLIVALAFQQGLKMDRATVQVAAGLLLVAFAAWRLLRLPMPRAPQGLHAGHAGMALWSFLMATAHGAGLMLVPALMPICMASGPAREITASGSRLLALAAVAVHMTAMLFTTNAIASGVCRGVAKQAGLFHRMAPQRLWPLALFGTGLLLVLLR